MYCTSNSVTQIQPCLLTHASHLIKVRWDTEECVCEVEEGGDTAVRRGSPGLCPRCLLADTEWHINLIRNKVMPVIRVFFNAMHCPLGCKGNFLMFFL